MKQTLVCTLLKKHNKPQQLEIVVPSSAFFIYSLVINKTKKNQHTARHVTQKPSFPVSKKNLIALHLAVTKL